MYYSIFPRRLVAELESRFHPAPEAGSTGGKRAAASATTTYVNQFIKDVEKFGFHLSWKDLGKVNFKHSQHDYDPLKWSGIHKIERDRVISSNSICKFNEALIPTGDLLLGYIYALCLVPQATYWIGFDFMIELTISPQKLSPSNACICF